LQKLTLLDKFTRKLKASGTKPTTIPIVSEVRTKTKTRKVYNEYTGKFYGEQKLTINQKKVVNSKKSCEFKKTICEKQLFDIASCKCFEESLCSCGRVMCNDARLFLEDQRTKRGKIIGLKYLRIRTEFG
jgi:hypothetical protein